MYKYSKQTLYVLLATIIFTRKKCSQIVAIGEYFGRFGYLCNYSEEIEAYKKSIVILTSYDT